MIDYSRINWSPEEEQIIYREWGLFFTKKQKDDIADLYYNKSLDLNPNDAKALFSRSRCKRRIAQVEGGLADAKRALELDDLRQPFNLEVCDGIYQLNEIEEVTLTAANLSRKFHGKKVAAFYQRLDVFHENFKDSLGDPLGYFILGHEKLFEKVYNSMKKKANVDKRPLWKILHEADECDILSIPEKEEILLSPREIARRMRAFCIYNQNYLGRSWADVLFLKALTTDESLQLPQSKLTSPILKTLTNSKYSVVIRMLKMLNARTPAYALRQKNCPNKAAYAKKKQSYLFRVQYQVHRNMLHTLRTLHYLRKKGKISLLRNYIEEVMGDYVVLKTRRVMPWKFQYINEVYNILALTLCDHMVDIPSELHLIPQKERLGALLKLAKEKEKEVTVFQFGDRSTHQDESSGDATTQKLKNLSTRLVNRLPFALYPISKAYLWHEIAVVDLKLNSVDRCCQSADKSYAEAEQCRSNIWMFLAVMMKCKAHAVSRRIEAVNQALNQASTIAFNINNNTLITFIRLCQQVNSVDLSTKKQPEVIQRTRSAYSTSDN